MWNWRSSNNKNFYYFFAKSVSLFVYYSIANPIFVIGRFIWHNFFTLNFFAARWWCQTRNLAVTFGSTAKVQSFTIVNFVVTKLERRFALKGTFCSSIKTTCILNRLIVHRRYHHDHHDFHRHRHGNHIHQIVHVNAISTARIAADNTTISIHIRIRIRIVTSHMSHVNHPESWSHLNARNAIYNSTTHIFGNRTINVITRSLAFIAKQKNRKHLRRSKDCGNTRGSNTHSFSDTNARFANEHSEANVIGRTMCKAHTSATKLSNVNIVHGPVNRCFKKTNMSKTNTGIDCEWCIANALKSKESDEKGLIERGRERESSEIRLMAIVPFTLKKLLDWSFMICEQSNSHNSTIFIFVQQKSVDNSSSWSQ